MGWARGLGSYINYVDMQGDSQISTILQKIAGRKRPALVDPSNKVRQGGKGSVRDGQTFGRTDGHFQSTSGPFGHHRWSYEASQL